MTPEERKLEVSARLRAYYGSPGTPKTLAEAITLALCMGPLCEVQERSYTILKDFITEKFTIAKNFHKQEPTTVALLNILLEELTKRKTS